MYKFNIDPVDYSKLGYKPEDIDPEILPIINKFNLAGCKTLFSCQGHAHLVTPENGPKYFNYDLPYVSFDNITQYDVARMIENIREHNLCTINLSHEAQLTEEQDENDYKFDSCTTVEEYAKVLDSFKKDIGFVVGLTMERLILEYPEFENEDFERDCFELARKRFLSELDKLAELLLGYHKVMEILYGEE